MFLKRKKEYWDYIPRYDPSVMLLSGGANDLLGARCRTCLGNLYYHLNDYQDGMGEDDLIRPSLKLEILRITALIGTMLAELGRDFSSLRVLVHGYDYPWPRGDKWLGKPMNARGIPRPLQRAVIIRILDFYNESLESAVRGANPNARYVNLLKTLTKGEWHDEIHPDSAGFRKIAEKVFAEI